MNKFAFGALAAPLLCATGLASDTEWPELDRELAALSNAPLTQKNTGPYLNGWLIGAFDYNADAEDTFGSSKQNTDVGFAVRSARVQLDGELVEGYGYRIGFDFFDTEEQLGYDPSATYDAMGSSFSGGITDAYGKFRIGDYLGFKLGVFTGPSLRSASIDRNKTLFIDRSFLGRQQTCRDAGVEANGSFDRIHWAVAGMNGTDDRTDGWGYSARVDVDLMGSMTDVEGAYGAPEGTNLNIGFVYSDDTSKDAAGLSMDVVQIAADATLVSGPLSVFGEVISYDKHNGPYYKGTLTSYQGTLLDVDSTPWSAGASYLIGEDVEIGFRYDNYDVSQTGEGDFYDAARYNFVANKYIDGHNIKWQLQFSMGDSKAQASTKAEKPGEHTIVSLALAVGF